MSLITPSPVSIPFFHNLEVPQGVTQTILNGTEFGAATVVIAGIDVTNPALSEGSACQVFVQTALNPLIILFQAFVYTTSQGSFSWRGELPLTAFTSVQLIAKGTPWDVHIWGAAIPPPRLSP